MFSVLRRLIVIVLFCVKIFCVVKFFGLIIVSMVDLKFLMLFNVKCVLEMFFDVGVVVFIDVVMSVNV